VGVEPDVRLADAARDQRALGRAHHSHRDIGVATGKVFVAVGQRELDRDARVVRMERREDRRQNFTTDDLARGDPHHPLIRRRFARGGARERGGSRRHRLDMGSEIRSRFGRREAARRTREQREAERGL
jgi:hypothetical protein